MFLAPGLRVLRRIPWFRIAFISLAIFPIRAGAQNQPGKAATKKDEPPPAAKKEDDKANAAVDQDEEAVIDSSKMKKNESVELIRDPNAEKALANSFKEYLPPRPVFSEAEKISLKNMAAKLSTTDRALLIRGVDATVSELTSHSNIRALLEFKPADVNKKANDNKRSIERAGQFLMELLSTARANNNQEFLNAYSAVVLEKMPPLLQNHLYSRLQAVILLASLGSPNAIDIFAKQLEDPNQTVWVKLWAARGLTNATNGGRLLLDVAKATAATKALVAIVGDQEMPWPVKMRAFEALGSIRLASTEGARGTPDIPAAGALCVADPKSHLYVRSQAAWSLGMIPIPSHVARYNFGVEAYLIGGLAAEIGEKIAADFDQYDKRPADFLKKSDSARYLTGLLLYDLYPAVAGGDVPNSGLLGEKHPSIAPTMSVLRGLEEQLKNLSRAADDLLSAGSGQLKGRRADLGSRIAELRAYVTKNKPADLELFPGGPKFSPSPSKVAIVPDGR